VAGGESGLWAVEEEVAREERCAREHQQIGAHSTAQRRQHTGTEQDGRAGAEGRRTRGAMTPAGNQWQRSAAAANNCFLSVCRSIVCSGAGQAKDGDAKTGAVAGAGEPCSETVGAQGETTSTPVRGLAGDDLVRLAEGKPFTFAHAERTILGRP
jgi:hypothetical protein